MVNLHRMKQEICEIGDRIYKRGFAAANDGNITYRVGENEVLCTPTMHCKGFLKPDDICLIDMKGNQLAGRKKRSSEALLHLEIMKARPDVKSVVHCHPPHATAFAVAREAIPQCVLPEVEVFLGDVPITKYETPGGKAFAETILPFVDRTNVIVLANHGTVSYGENVERAYWWTEILDSYCRILLLSKQIGRVEYLSHEKSQELLDLKKQWGFTDPRHEEGFKNCDICANDVFRSSWNDAGVKSGAFGAPDWNGSPAGSSPAPGGGGVDEDQLVRTITDRVLAALQAGV
ncbi:MAG: class II aldolase/adducin family protein [Pirellulales bacterium]|nr:class II aldolase/adducin family protein [Pirellulales bacterium]MBX3434917.1 class II aldolase/adducin family protein [Pirellulales bacterium]